MASILTYLNGVCCMGWNKNCYFRSDVKKHIGLVLVTGDYMDISGDKLRLLLLILMKK